MAERHPVAHAAARAAAGRAGRARRAAVAPLLPGRRPRGLRRGDRAGAARQPRVRAGVDRAAAADLRPAGLLPLARRAAVRDSTEFEQLVGIVDRLIVDSTEWPDLPAAYGRLAELFAQVVVSDIAWARTERWRSLLASLWPDIADVSAIRVQGTRAQGHLLARLAALAARARRRGGDRGARAARGDRPGRAAGTVPARAAAERERRPARRNSTASAATRSTKQPSAPPRA